MKRSYKLYLAKLSTKSDTNRKTVHVKFIFAGKINLSYRE